MSEQPNPAGLDEDQLAEAEAQSDVMDADIEDAAPQDGPSTPETAAGADLSEDELAEADAQADVIDADVEGP